LLLLSGAAVCSEDILAMEKQMLASLQYDLTVPTCYLFTARFRKAAGVADDLKVTQPEDEARWCMIPSHGMWKAPASTTQLVSPCDVVC
jgi:hypothetical protein